MTTNVPAAHPPAIQLDALTSLRFLAALYVLLFHYVPVLSRGTLDPLVTRLGFSGVTFFFVLSGFILAYTYEHTDLTQRPARLRYAAARLARIYPLFLLALLAGVPFWLKNVLAMPAGAERTLALAAALLAPLGLHAWVPGAACTLNCPSWSISTEFFFYLAFPLLLAPILKAPARWLVITLVAWAVIVAIDLAVWQRAAGTTASILAEPDSLTVRLAGDAIKFFPLGRLPEFMLGILLYAYWRPRRDSISPAAGYLAFAIAAAGLLYATPLLSTIVVHTGVTALAWAPLILAAASTRQGPLCAPTAVYLGRISFALYLLHMPVLSTAIVLDAKLSKAALLATPGLAIPVVTLLAILAACLAYETVEKPLRPWLYGRLLRAWGLDPTATQPRTAPAPRTT